MRFPTISLTNLAGGMVYPLPESQNSNSLKDSLPAKRDSAIMRATTPKSHMPVDMSRNAAMAASQPKTDRTVTMISHHVSTSQRMMPHRPRSGRVKNPAISSTTLIGPPKIPASASTSMTVPRRLVI